MERQCSRCGGCGLITGTGRDERPWAAFRGVPLHLALEKALGMRHPQPCPNCDGTGIDHAGVIHETALR